MLNSYQSFHWGMLNFPEGACPRFWAADFLPGETDREITVDSRFQEFFWQLEWSPGVKYPHFFHVFLSESSIIPKWKPAPILSLWLRVLQGLISDVNLSDLPRLKVTGTFSTLQRGREEKSKISCASAAVARSTDQKKHREVGREWSCSSGVGKCPFLGILNITFKYLLEIISPILGWCSIGTFTNPCSSSI